MGRVTITYVNNLANSGILRIKPIPDYKDRVFFTFDQIATIVFDFI